MTTGRVLLGIGTNVGDRLRHLREAVRALGTAESREVRVAAVSPIYESDALLPEGAPPQWDQPYLNLALVADTTLDPNELLAWIKTTEVALGRRPAARWSPREIDIDLLAMEGVSLSGQTLTLPHRDLLARPFALLPAADLVPTWRLDDELTGSTRSVAEWATRWRGEPALVPFRTRRIPASLSELVGIVNLTADSFSDGGRWLDPARAIAGAAALAEAGATVIDLGAESTRPGAVAVDPVVEWARLQPVLSALRERWPRGIGPRLSVDTRQPATAVRAIEAGVDWINDVTGFEDSAMIAAVAGSDVDLVAMHNLGVPPESARVLERSRDPMVQLLASGFERLTKLEQAGISRARVIFDPGIGFGKTGEQTAAVLRRVGEFRALGARLLVGHSRKSFLKTWFAAEGTGTCATAADRDVETLALTQQLAAWTVDYIRVHDVGANARVLRAGAMVQASTRWMT